MASVNAPIANLSFNLSNEVKAWRWRFPKDCVRVNKELEFFAINDPRELVTMQDELDIWRRWNPDFRFRPQDDMVALR